MPSRTLCNAGDAEGSGGAIHDEGAIDLAWARVRSFFGRHLSADPRAQVIPGGVLGPARRTRAELARKKSEL